MCGLYITCPPFSFYFNLNIRYIEFPTCLYVFSHCVGDSIILLLHGINSIDI